MSSLGMITADEWRKAVDDFHLSPKREQEAEYQYYGRLLLSLRTLLLQMPYNLRDFHPDEVNALEDLTKLEFDKLFSLEDPADIELPSDSDLHQRRLHLLALIRAFDKLTFDAGSGTLGSLATEQLFCPDANAYLIPIKRFNVNNTNKLTLPRGVLIRHRVLPATVSGQKILPVIPPRSDPAPAESPIFGAALFSGLKLTLDKEDGPDFLCTDCRSTTYDEQLQKHLDNMQSQETLVTTWAELSVRPDAREKIVNSLTDSQSLCRPAITVTGTWHEHHAQGKATNTGHVFDRAGRSLLSFHKMQPYRLKKKYPERIDLNHEIPILILNGWIITFAICLDFCNNSRENPFQTLDVDLIIVPSFGDLNTERGHIDGAGRIHTDQGAQVFVVQQPYPTNSQAAGSVLHPGSPPPKEFTMQQAPWQTYPS